MTEGRTVRRLMGGISGQAAMRLAMLLRTVALVPALVAAWGVEVYGAWLALTALGSYVGLTNFGLSNASGNAMLQAVGAGDEMRAQRVFNSTLGVLLSISVPAVAAICALAFFAPVGHWLNLTDVSGADVSLVLALAAVQVWLNTIRAVYVAAICTTGRYGLPNFISAAARTLEVGGIAAAVLVWDAGIADAAVILAVAALLELLVQVVICQQLVAWARLRFRDMHAETVRKLVKPSLGNVVLQIGVNAIVIQGPRVLLSLVAGPAAVALFAIHATAIRLADQVTMLFGGPVQMEIASSVGAEQFDRAATLNAVGTQAALVVALGAAAGLALIGPVLFEYWTLGKVAFDYSLFALLAASVIVNNFGRMSLITLIGANRILAPALLMLPVTGIAIVAGGLLAYPLGVYGMGVGDLAAQAGVAVISVVAAARAVRLSPGALLNRIMDLRATRELLWPLISRRRLRT